MHFPFMIILLPHAIVKNAAVPYKYTYFYSFLLGAIHGADVRYLSFPP